MASHTTLPHAPIGRLMGLIETMRETPARETLSQLARALHLRLDDLLPLIEAARLLGLASITQGRYELTEAGVRIADADERERKKLIRARAGELPILRTILDALAALPGHKVQRTQILRAIRARLPRKEAVRQLETAIDWGRYAELLDYDAETGCLIRTPQFR